MVQSKRMYEAYVAWSVDVGRKPVTNTKFGLLMKNKVRRDDSKSRHYYLDVELHDVPELTPEMREKFDLGRGGPAENGPLPSDDVTF